MDSHESRGGMRGIPGPAPRPIVGFFPSDLSLFHRETDATAGPLIIE